MQTLGSFRICGMSLLFGVKCAKIDNLLIMRDLSFPAPFAFSYPGHKDNPLQPRLIAMLAVRPVLAVSRLSKVFKSVIRAVPIYMVNNATWHRSSYKKPNKPMGRIKFPVNLKMDVSFMMKAPRFCPNLNSGSGPVPVQIPRSRVIAKDGSKCGVINHASFYRVLEKTASEIRG